MQFRLPKRAWEWVLLFSPTLAIWAASAIWLAFPHRGDVGVLLVGPFIGSCIAFVLSFWPGHLFTNPNPQIWVRRTGISLAAILIAVLNFTIAFAGCAVVLR